MRLVLVRLVFANARTRLATRGARLTLCRIGRSGAVTYSIYTNLHHSAPSVYAGPVA